MSEGAISITMTRVPSAARIILPLLPLMIIGCQLGFGAQPAPMHPPLPAPPPAMGQTKVIDGYLEVWYKPCERGPSPFDWVAPMKLTDLRSGSVIYLNTNGTVKARPKPRYKTEEGKATLEAVLEDSSLIKQVVARPECVYPRTLRHRDGWPDPQAVDVGDPPIPKVAMGISWPNALESHWVYPGWRGAYCWPMGGGSRECENTTTWEGFSAADPIPTRSNSRIYFTLLGDDTNPGRIKRIQLFTTEEKLSILRLGRVLHLGEEVYALEAKEGETLEELFVMPNLPGGDYMLIAGYESQLGGVEYGFRVSQRSR